MTEQLRSDETYHPTASEVLYAMAREIILENAGGRLRSSSYPPLWKITCDFCEGVLTLHGVVGSYFLKQVAQTAVVDVEGVNEVANRLEVRHIVRNSNDRAIEPLDHSPARFK
jgi:osmotically-inducible protein OsmY